MKHLFKRTPFSTAFDIFNVLILTVFTFLCLYPFYYMIIFSISEPARAGQVMFWPQGFTLFNFQQVFQLRGIGQAFFMSVLRTVVGTAVTVFCCSLLGYLFSKQEMPARTFLYRALIITMYVSGGLIPTYLVFINYGLFNSFWVYIFPAAVSAFNVILVKTYIEQLPASLEESAMIDGAGYFRIYFWIIFPLSLPIIATIAVFAAVGRWNAWFDTYIFTNRDELRTMQVLLRNFIEESHRIARLIQEGGGIHEAELAAGRMLSPRGVQITVTVIATLPILFVYPFMQRFFMKGIMIGAVKG